MKNLDNLVVLITGGSSGIGRACAEVLKSNGCRVYGTSRKNRADLDVKTGNGFIEMIRMDVNSEEFVEKGVEYIVQKEGRIDVVINSAGYCLAGAIEDTTPAEAKEIFETNFFGVLRVCRAVLPIMRAQKSGRIINISSVAGLIVTPYQSFYSSTKFALESMTLSLRVETEPFGIGVSLIEPGDVKTGFTKSRVYTKLSGEGSVYKKYADKAINKMIEDELNGIPPERVAKVVMKAVLDDPPKARYYVGFDYRLLVFLKRFLPLGVELWGIKKYFRIK